jgi:hypothetical protein
VRAFRDALPGHLERRSSELGLPVELLPEASGLPAISRAHIAGSSGSLGSVGRDRAGCGPDGRPYRPWAGLWVSRKTGFVHFKIEPEPGSHDWTLALDALVEFGLKRRLTGYRPGTLEVADKELGVRLLDAIGDQDLALTALPDLPAARRVLAEMTEHMAGAPMPPNALDAAGVTVERMRAFAEAARRFNEAAPWRHLSDEDLIHVEAPAVERGLSHVTVLGAGGQTFGLGFFESVADFTETKDSPEPERFMARARWSLFYGPISHLPFGDADLWEEHGLPVAGDDAYPVAIQFKPGGKPHRPDAGVRFYLEGLLRALAETTENEMDQGRWTRRRSGREPACRTGERWSVSC